MKGLNGPARPGVDTVVMEGETRVLVADDPRLVLEMGDWSRLGDTEAKVALNHRRQKPPRWRACPRTHEARG